MENLFIIEELLYSIYEENKFDEKVIAGCKEYLNIIYEPLYISIINLFSDNQIITTLKTLILLER